MEPRKRSWWILTCLYMLEGPWDAVKPPQKIPEGWEESKDQKPFMWKGWFKTGHFSKYPIRGELSP